MDTLKKKSLALKAIIVAIIIAVGGNFAYQTNNITDVASDRITERDRQFDSVLANQKVLLQACSTR